MPVDLHQRLSEFSYGYGVTRKVQHLLESVGLRPTPFLPSLLHEAKLGFDVSFDRPGTALLIQFKLGQELLRFRRTNPSSVIPALDRPFWRFSVDTAERNGQFDLLLKAEQYDAEVYYVAPRFAHWDDYASAFQAEEVLDRSLLMRPSEIDGILAAQGEPDGWHRIVYDASRVYVCSEPVRAKEVVTQQFAEAIHARIRERSERADLALKRVYESFGHRRDIRVPPVEETREEAMGRIFSVPVEQLGRTPEQLADERARRLAQYRDIAKTDGDALFAAVGLESWALDSLFKCDTEVDGECLERGFVAEAFSWC